MEGDAADSGSRCRRDYGMFGRAFRAGRHAERHFGATDGFQDR